uniref:Follicle stimulating hormone receptor n=1 Tax=Sinocyclocheilus anshuiensis TaxID=1608454 RepID=A0A671NPR9_9TELE
MVLLMMLYFSFDCFMPHTEGMFAGSHFCSLNGSTRYFFCNKVHEIPRYIPKNTTSVEIKLTQISVLHRAALSELHELKRIVVSENDALERIEDYAFYNLTELKEITITKSKNLVIQKDAFWRLPKLQHLTISNTGLKFLPDFSKINSAALEFLFNTFLGLTIATITELRLTGNGIRAIDSYAFDGTKIEKLFLMGNQQLSHIHPYAFIGAEGPIVLDISRTSVHTLPESMLKLLTATYVSSLRKLPSLELFTELKQANLTYASHCCAFNNFKKSVKNQIILAMVGNCAVLLVLLTSRYKLTVRRFLMCHLAFADLCMGIYLLIIAAKDIQTQSRYYNYGIDWQMGAGCHAAGFFTVISYGLSVYTLTAIALERWHTITYAMQLCLCHPCTIMAAGWLFALLTALLPIFGVSSYSKTSICLPMDVETVISQGYVMLLLLLNVAAFLIVCVCYMSIYLTVHNATFVPAHANMRIAKCMAVLIFTDFLCMAPISFFAISASLKLPLITVSHAKVLLVFFSPVNSCSNPFLYAFFTQTFKRDFFILTKISSGQNEAMVPSLKTSDGTLYSLVHVAQVH